jgi:putative ABC transport system substrate-binding protein
LCLLLPVPSAWSYDLLILQSQRSAAYDEVLKGFRSIAHFSERVIVLSDYNDIDLVRIIREEGPLAIVTLGDRALSAARKVRQTPVIALMALTYKGGSGGRFAVTGVEIQSSPERYAQIFVGIKARRVGVVSNPEKNGAYIRSARKIMAGYGIDLVVRDVASPREVSNQLNSLNGAVDALWMLPDSTTSSGEAADAHFLFSLSQKIPVVTFSSAYLTSGAALALDIDRYDMGKQGGEMATSLLKGAGIAGIASELPRKTTIRSNSSVLHRLELKPDFAVRGTE